MFKTSFAGNNKLVLELMPSPDALLIGDIEDNKEALRLWVILQMHRKAAKHTFNQHEEEANLKLIRSETLQVHSYILLALKTQLNVAKELVEEESHKKNKELLLPEEDALFKQLEIQYNKTKEYLHKERFLEEKISAEQIKLDDTLTEEQQKEIWNLFKQLEKTIFELRYNLLAKMIGKAKNIQQVLLPKAREKSGNDWEKIQSDMPFLKEKEEENYLSPIETLKNTLKNLHIQRDSGLNLWKEVALNPTRYKANENLLIKSLKSLMENALWRGATEQKLKMAALAIDSNNKGLEHMSLVKMLSCLQEMHKISPSLVKELKNAAQSTGDKLQWLNNMIQGEQMVKELTHVQENTSETDRIYHKLKKHVSTLQANGLFEKTVDLMKQHACIDNPAFTLLEKIEAEKQQSHKDFMDALVNGEPKIILELLDRNPLLATSFMEEKEHIYETAVPLAWSTLKNDDEAIDRIAIKIGSGASQEIKLPSSKQPEKFSFAFTTNGATHNIIGMLSKEIQGNYNLKIEIQGNKNTISTKISPSHKDIEQKGRLTLNVPQIKTSSPFNKFIDSLEGGSRDTPSNLLVLKILLIAGVNLSKYDELITSKYNKESATRKKQLSKILEYRKKSATNMPFLQAIITHLGEHADKGSEKQIKEIKAYCKSQLELDAEIEVKIEQNISSFVDMEPVKEHKPSNSFAEFFKSLRQKKSQVPGEDTNKERMLSAEEGMGEDTNKERMLSADEGMGKVYRNPLFISQSPSTTPTPTPTPGKLRNDQSRSLESLHPSEMDRRRLFRGHQGVHLSAENIKNSTPDLPKKSSFWSAEDIKNSTPAFPRRGGLFNC